jgi:hypothetical protein
VIASPLTRSATGSPPGTIRDERRRQVALGFSDQLLDDVAYQEYAVGGHVIDDKSVVSALDTLFSELRAQSLGPSESLAMIAQLAEHTHVTKARRDIDGR